MDGINADIFINNHKHICYCEAIIFPDGSISYSIPSHTEILLSHYCKIKNCDREKATYDYLHSKISCVIQFLCNETKCVAVWYYEMMVPCNGCTLLQKETIDRLRSYGCIDATADIRVSSDMF